MEACPKKCLNVSILWKLPQNIHTRQHDTFIRLLRLRRQGGRIIRHLFLPFLPSASVRFSVGCCCAACGLSPVATSQDFYFKATLLLPKSHSSKTSQCVNTHSFNWRNLWTFQHNFAFHISCQYQSSMLSYRDVKTVCAKCDLFQLHIQAAAKPIITVELNSERAPLITRFCYNSSRLLW